MLGTVAKRPNRMRDRCLAPSPISVEVKIRVARCRVLGYPLDKIAVTRHRSSSSVEVKIKGARQRVLGSVEVKIRVARHRCLAPSRSRSRLPVDGADFPVIFPARCFPI